MTYNHQLPAGEQLVRSNTQIDRGAVSSAELQLKNPLGEQELRHRSHFGQGERFCGFC
jgi:hypothetical protein